MPSLSGFVAAIIAYSGRRQKRRWEKPPAAAGSRPAARGVALGGAFCYPEGMAGFASGGFVRKVLMVNGAGDIAFGLLLIFMPHRLGSLVRLDPDATGVYLAGGWGVAALSFGLLRVFAGWRAGPAVAWFTAVFGLIEGTSLTLYGAFSAAAGKLSPVQVSLSTVFALVFTLAYGAAFLRRRRELAGGPSR